MINDSGNEVDDLLDDTEISEILENPDYDDSILEQLREDRS